MMARQQKTKRSSSCPPLGSRRRSKRNSQSNISTLASHILTSYFQSTSSSLSTNTRSSDGHRKAEGTKQSSSHVEATSIEGDTGDSHSSEKNTILFITGAGLSVPSGVRPFRGKDGLWSQTLWTNATRDSFRSDPLAWYNDFWLKFFSPPTPKSTQDVTHTSDTTTTDVNRTSTGSGHTSSDDACSHPLHNYEPNEAHEALGLLCSKYPNVKIITQNIDGLASKTKTKWDTENQLIECHGRLGLFKCIPNEDSDTSEDETDDDFESDDETSGIASAESISTLRRVRRRKRDVKLGSIRKQQEWKNKFKSSIAGRSNAKGGRNGSNEYAQAGPCLYEMEDSIKLQDILPIETRQILSGQYTAEDSTRHVDEARDTVEINVRGSAGGVPTSSTAETVTNESYMNTEIVSISSSASSSSMVPLSESSGNTSSSSSETSEDSAPRKSTHGISSFINDSGSNLVSTAPSATTTNKRKVGPNEDVGMASKRAHKRKNTRIVGDEYIPRLRSPPLCPCGRPLAPQALLFDEGYHSHTFYQFDRMESWISNAKVIVFVGTSFAVNITSVVLDHARDNGLLVYNFNVDGGDLLESTTRLNAVNIVGDVSKTLPELWSACSFLEKEPFLIET